MYNQAYNLYDMYDYHNPGIRLNFSIDVNFIRVNKIKYYYKISSSTGYQIGDNGLKNNISVVDTILY